MRRTTATTTKNNNRLKDLTNTNNKEKEQEDINKRNAITPEIPDSRPSRMTASIVVEASSSPRCLGEKKEAQKQKKKKSTTFPAAGTRRKRVAAKKKEEDQDEDFDDLLCEEEPLIGKRRRKGAGKASNTTRSRSGKISKISSFFLYLSSLVFFASVFLLFLNSKNWTIFQNRCCLNKRNKTRVYLKILTRDIFFSLTQINHLYHQFHRKMTARKEKTTISTTRRRWRRRQ